MLRELACVGCLGLVGCGGDSVKDEPAKFALADAARVAGTRVDLRAPAGFEPAEGVRGLARPDGSAKIGVFELPTPFEGAVPEGPEDWARNGMTLLTSEELVIAGSAGRLYSVERAVHGERMRGWMAVTGDDREALILMAECKLGEAAALEPALRECLLSARWDRSAALASGAAPAFEVQPAGDLALSTTDGASKVFTPGGRQPPHPAGSPFLIVGTASGALGSEGLEEFSKARLEGALTSVGTGVVEIESSTAVQLGSLRGWELVARTSDPELELALFAYQVLVPLDTGFATIQGHGGAEFRAAYLPLFRETAATFRVE